jgi:glycosyltransferase involved in cell wall biosynthesis
VSEHPFFSVLVSAYNRAREAERCVRSCIAQTFEDLEIVLVDDGSTDATVPALEALAEPRLRIVRHQQNRGISAARATAVEQARGQWYVILDSDWELLPHSLARLRELVDGRPEGVRIIRSRLRWDDGRIEPEIMPATPVTGYVERIEWLEAVIRAGAGSDAGHCMHRSVFGTTSFYADRRGAMEGLWELDLARRERSLWVEEVLGLEHVDAENSYTRDADPSRMISGMLREAPDMLWMFETMISAHGDELARRAPSCRRGLDQGAAAQAFLSGDRARGVRHTVAAVRAGGGDPRTLATLALGLLGPRALARAKLTGRRSRAPARGPR